MSPLGACLGRIGHDPGALANAPQIAGHPIAAIGPPAQLVRQNVALAPGLYQNDILPDCTAVALANAARAFGVLNDAEPLVDPRAVPAFYAATIARTGASRAELRATDGARMLDVLRFQQRSGFDIGEQTPLVADFAVADPTDRRLLASIMARLGVGYWGVDLALADQLAPVWDVTTPGDQTPGSWGAHCVIAWDYSGLGDTDLVTLGTWGRWQQATWRWVRTRLVEAYGLAWRQLMPATGVTWLGLDYDRLRAENIAWIG